MKKYNNPTTSKVDVRVTNFICASPGGGGTEHGTAPQRITSQFTK